MAAAKVVFLTFAGYWSPVFADVSCCAEKRIGWNDGALKFGKVHYQESHGGYHCGAGLELDISAFGGGFFASRCDMDAWITKAATDRTIFADPASLVTKAYHSLNRVLEQPKDLNTTTKHFRDKTFYYFKKLLAQVAYFSKDYSFRKNRNKGLNQGSEQTAILFQLATITAGIRLQCKPSCFLADAANALNGNLNNQDNVLCETLKDQKQTRKQNYCEFFRSQQVDPKKMRRCAW